MTGHPAGSPDAAGGPIDAASAPPKDGAPAARCDVTKPFGAPTLVAELDTSIDEEGFALTRDETTGFVIRKTQTGTSLLVTKRGASDAAFGPPSTDATDAINATASGFLSVSAVADGLTIYLWGPGNKTVVASRVDATSAFDAGAPVDFNGIGSLMPAQLQISGDGQTLYFYDVNTFSGMRSATRQGPKLFGDFQLVSDRALGAISADELTAFYYNGSGITMVSRPNKTSAFASPVDVAAIQGFADVPMAVTADGCVLYFSSNRPSALGGDNLWAARRPE